MQPLLSILGTATALVMCGVSVAMNWLFLASLGKTPLEGHVLGAASAAADVLKALLPFFIAWSWQARRYFAAILGSLGFFFFAGFSLLSAVGFAADNRGTLVDGRERISHEYTRVRRELADAEASRAALPAHRPAAVVSEEIGAHRQNRRWSATKGCEDATETESRAFCAEYFHLRAELAAAKEENRLAAQISALQAASAKLRESGAEQDSDPQVSLLSRVTGREREPVRLALVIAVALLVEIGASLGLFLASGHRPVTAANAEAQGSAKNADEAGPAGCVEEFCLEALVSSSRAVLSPHELQDGYRQWCDREGRTPLRENMFAAVFGELATAVGIPREQSGWRGIALKHDRAALDMVS